MSYSDEVERSINGCLGSIVGICIFILIVGIGIWIAGWWL